MSKSYIFAQFLFVTLLSRGFSDHQHSCPSEEKEHWSYNNKLSNGPPHWGENYPNCNGKNQSPVNIKKNDVEKDKNLEPLQLKNYDRPVQKALVQNNGHTVVVTPKDGVDRTVMVNNMPYSLVQFHFHWGAKSDRGSEHTVNGKGYAMELHLVHRNADGKLAVVGVFFKQSHKNGGLVAIVNSFKNIPYKGDEVEIKDRIDLLKLVNDKCSFYRYVGSLTTPPCDEGVIWTVCKEPKLVAYAQLKGFRGLFSVTKNTEGDKNECKISDNFRDTQPLNGRKITCSK